MRTPYARWLAMAAVLATAAGCASDKSFALVSVRAEPGAGPFMDVVQLQVDVVNDVTRDRLDYPKTPTARVTFDETQPVTFSVGYNHSKHQGLLQIGVTAIGARGQPLGYGEGMATIDPDHVIEVPVRIRRGATPPPLPDAGAVDARVSAGDGGRDLPPGMTCDPVAPTTCGGGTCFVGCTASGAAVGMCTLAGAKAPGEACTRNEDCTAGSQCFALACGVKVCQRFCKADGDCGGGRCSTSVPCGMKETGFKICSQPCDPTGVATQGCAAGLNCFLFANETPDCDCRGAKHMAGDGTACTDASDCQPGLFCVAMGGPRVCRALCRLDAPKCAAGFTCEQLHDPDLKVFGACLPP